MGDKKEQPIGVVTHYYGNIGVAIVKFARDVKKGEEVRFKGATTDFTEKIDSIQYNHKDLELAAKGKEVGLKVKEKVRDGDEIFEVL